jgi:hypothetical protein
MLNASSNAPGRGEPPPTAAPDPLLLTRSDGPPTPGTKVSWRSGDWTTVHERGYGIFERRQLIIELLRQVLEFGELIRPTATLDGRRQLREP